METITFRVSSLSAVLMNNPLSMTKTGGGLGTKQIPTPEVEAAAKVYRMPSGQLYLPSIHFRASILNAVKGMRIGRAAARQIFASSLFLTDEFCPLVDPETLSPIMEYEIDVQRAVVGTAGVLRARPKVPTWACSITFEYDEAFLTDPVMISSAFERAGKIAGIGDYRPACPKGAGGPYGRYQVTAK